MKTQINQYKPKTVSHPGSTLVEKLQEINMRSKEFAEKINTSEKIVLDIINGKGSITPNIAVNFENILKIPASFWLNRQKNYDEYLARLNKEVIITK